MPEKSSAPPTECQDALQECHDTLFNAPIGIFTSTPQGQFLSVNPAYAKMYGYDSPEELVASVSDISSQIYASPDDRTSYFQLFDNTEAVVNYESRHKRKDGSIFWTSESVHLVRDHDGRVSHLQGFTLDISQRKEAELAEQHSREEYRKLSAMLRLLCDNVPDMIWAKDLQKRYIFANKAVCRDLLNAVDTDEPIGKTDLFFARRERESHPEDPEWHSFGEICRDTDQITMDAGESRQFDEYGNIQGEFQFLDVRKAPFLDEQGKMIGTVGSARSVTEYRRAEAALRESEARNRALLSALPDMIFLFDRYGVFLDYHAADPTGLLAPPESFLGKPVAEVLSVEIAEMTMAHIEEIVRCGKTSPYLYEVNLNGEIRFFEGRMEPCTENTFLTVVRDVTDRKRAEDELLLQSRLQELLTQISSTYISLPLDRLEETLIDSLREMGELVGADRAYLFDYDFSRQICRNTHEWCAAEIEPQQELLQNVPLALIPEQLGPHQRGEAVCVDDILALPEASGLRHILEPQGIQSMLALPLMDGEECLGFTGFDFVRRRRQIGVQEQRLLTMFAQLLVNIRKRHAADQALRESEDRFRVLFDQGPDPLFIWRMDDTLLDINEAACALLGYPREELLRMTLPEIQAPSVRKRLGETIRAELQITSFEGLNLQRDGREVPVEIVTVPIRLQGEEHGLSSVRDISERKQAEEERQKLQSQLIQAQKMESVGRLAGGVAHDFNNMLGVILGYAELALCETGPGQKLYRHLQQILRAAEHSADLTRQLLAFARQQSVILRVVDLNETVEGMLKMLRRLIGEDINLAWLPGKGLWPVKIDPSQIDQILANLCVNARDALNGNGRITIETANKTLDQGYCTRHLGAIAGDYVQLAVRDNGCGMDGQTLEKLFDPFFTTKEIGKGTGLGLSTVYGIVKQNKGYVEVRSEPGNGAEFLIFLPRHQGEVGERAVVPPIVELAPPGEETILLVEDEQMILDLTSTMLERLGYTVLAASSPGEALRLAEQRQGGIDLLITDVVMPEMNGRELVEQLRPGQPAMKWLYMSGYTADIISSQGVLDEGVSFIQKPFPLNALAKKVREVLDRRENR
jgi:PAS domain S-box-containing protein